MTTFLYFEFLFNFMHRQNGLIRIEKSKDKLQKSNFGTIGHEHFS